MKEREETTAKWFKLQTQRFHGETEIKQKKQKTGHGFSSAIRRFNYDVTMLKKRV
jgi:hypothetical protein